MKTIILTSVFLGLSFIAKTQDLIVKRDGDDIKVKVIEVNTTEIKFKKYDNLEGPLFTVLKSDVLFIKYENGSKEIYSTAVKTSSNENHKNGIYISLSVGNALPIASQKRGENFDGSAYSLPSGTGSYGRGYQFGGILGFSLSKNVSSELGITYLKSADQTTTDNTPGNEAEFVTSSSMLRLIPSIKLTTDGDKVKLYLKAGWLCALNTDFKMSIRENYNNSKYESIYDYTGGFSQGFSGAIGGDFTLGKKMDLYTELVFIAQSWAPQKMTLTKYKVDGVDELASVPQYYKEIEFVESYTKTSTINYNETQKRVIDYLPFSSVGINIGLKIML